MRNESYIISRCLLFVHPASHFYPPPFLLLPITHMHMNIYFVCAIKQQRQIQYAITFFYTESPREKIYIHFEDMCMKNKYMYADCVE